MLLRCISLQQMTKCRFSISNKMLLVPFSCHSLQVCFLKEGKEMPLKTGRMQGYTDRQTDRQTIQDVHVLTHSQHRRLKSFSFLQGVDKIAILLFYYYCYYYYYCCCCCCCCSCCCCCYYYYYYYFTIIFFVF